MKYSENHLKIILEKINTNPKELICILGPTCTGKTDLSLRLAQEFNIPIINADSRLIFLEMDIGTAKPSEEEISSVRHYLINIKSPNQSYSAGEYRKDFDKSFEEIKKINSSKPRAIVVGGTGLYIKSALENLDMPNISRDPKLREELNNLDLNSLLILLNELDPEAEKDLDIKNKIRIIRAIEIIKGTGKTLKESRGKNLSHRYEVAYFGLNFSQRETLYNLINIRVLKMINKGLVEEVKTLITKYGISETLSSTIGYKEIIEYLKNRCSMDDAIAQIQQNTRQYAKRQMTWFNKNQDIIWLNADENLIPS